MIFGAGELPLSLGSCPLCRASDVGIDHLMTSCSYTCSLLATWASSLAIGTSVDLVSWDVVCRLLFSFEDVPRLEAGVLLVGRCCELVADACLLGQQPEQLDDMILEAQDLAGLPDA